MAGTQLVLSAGLSLTIALSPGVVAGQSIESGRAGPRAVMDRGLEVALALSAAPTAVTDEAAVLAWTGEGFEVAREGTNGVTCYVARSWPDSLEPHCFDEEGSKTILPIHLREMELSHRGLTRPQINAEIAEGIRSGELRLPERPVMSYMMSEGQRLINDEGEPVGSWRPHLMIYHPYLTPESMGLGPVPSTDAAVIVDPGTPLSNIMVVVSDFVPVPTETTRDDAREPVRTETTVDERRSPARTESRQRDRR